MKLLNVLCLTVMVPSLLACGDNATAPEEPASNASSWWRAEVLGFSEPLRISGDSAVFCTFSDGGVPYSALILWEGGPPEGGTLGIAIAGGFSHLARYEIDGAFGERKSFATYFHDEDESQAYSTLNYHAYFDNAERAEVEQESFVGLHDNFANRKRGRAVVYGKRTPDSGGTLRVVAEFNAFDRGPCESDS